MDTYLIAAAASGGVYVASKVDIPVTPEKPTEPDLLTVEQAQRYIDDMNFYSGVWGFQEAFADYDLVADGEIGPGTIGALELFVTRGRMLTDNFHLDEFRCTHCGRARVKRELVRVLQAMRTELGPMGRFSSFRCPNHPIEAVKDSPGQHASGLAWDPNPNFTVEFAERYGAVGIGYASADNGRCTHFDMRPGGRVYFVDN